MNRRARRALAAAKSNCAGFRTSITPPRFRRGLLLGASGLTLAITLGAADEAAALDECGTASGTPPSVTCTSAGNPYATGIRYEVEDLTIVVDSGVAIDSTATPGAGGIFSGGQPFVTPAGSGDLTITVSPGVSIKASGDYGAGVTAYTRGGDAAVSFSGGTISTYGARAAGLIAWSETGDATVNASGTIQVGGWRADGIDAFTFADNTHISVNSSAAITTTGELGFGIVGDTGSGNNADVVITSSGKISTTGRDGAGLYSFTFGVDSDINIANLGTIIAAGEEVNGIRAIANRADSDIIAVSTGTITTTGANAAGIAAGTVEGNSDVLVVSTAAITTTGDDSHAIIGVAGGAGSRVAIASTAALTTSGGGADGIFALTAGIGSKASVVSTGVIGTADDEADGIHVRALGAGSSATIVAGAVTTAGDEADGIDGDTAGNLTVAATGTIATDGDESAGIRAHASGGAIVISSNSSITTEGQGADAVRADAGGAITVGLKDASADGMDADGIDASNAGPGAVRIGIVGGVSGGWRTGVGVKIKAVDGAAVNIGADGSVGALSDFALTEGGENLLFTNRGTITGFFNTDGGNDTINNAATGVWEFRNFADTDGDGVRDRERVAFANFGPGTDVFGNRGTVRLSSVAGAATVESVGQIADPFGTDGDVTLAGVEHGQMVGLERFVNIGTITLQDGTVGDALAITDQPIAGAGGAGNFISNGGALRLDVVLDDGSSGATDMLFLDRASTGAGGATRVFVNNVGGAGALTAGDGIEIINVDVSSTSDAFTLGAPVVAGAFQYDLEFQNLAGTDQNWYLRSTPFAGAKAYPAIASSAVTAWQADLASLAERLSDLRLRMTRPQAPATMAGIAADDGMRLDPARLAGGWARLTDSSDQVAQGGIAGFSQETAGTQFGYDFALDNVFGRNDWLVLGAFGGQGWSEAEFDQADSTADFDTSAMGAYASYFNGPYHLDALVKFDWLDGDYSSAAVSGGDVALPVFGASLNTGYRFDLAKSETGALSLQPLAGLDYAHVGGDSFHDDSGAEIQLLEMDSLRGRLGARLVRELLPAEDGTAPVGSLYLEAGIAQEFLGQSRARVTGVTLEQDLPATTLQFGAGFDIALPGEGVSFTFGTSADLSEGEDNFGATGGVKFTW